MKPITVEQYAVAIGAELQVRKLKAKEFTASFKRGETKAAPFAGVLTAEFGKGTTASEAVRDYAHRLNGRWLVLDASRDTRREFHIPRDFLK